MLGGRVEDERRGSVLFDGDDIWAASSSEEIKLLLLVFAPQSLQEKKISCD